MIQGFGTQAFMLCEDEKKVYPIYYVWYELRKKEEGIYTFHARHILEPRRDRRLAMLDMLPADIPPRVHCWGLYGTAGPEPLIAMGEAAALGEGAYVEGVGEGVKGWLRDEEVPGVDDEPCRYAWGE